MPNMASGRNSLSNSTIKNRLFSIAIGDKMIEKIKALTEGKPVRLMICDDPEFSAQDGAASDFGSDWDVFPIKDDAFLFVGTYTQFVGHPGYATPDVYEVTLRILYAKPGTISPSDYSFSDGKSEVLIEVGG